jgi:hypothetical protein
MFKKLFIFFILSLSYLSFSKEKATIYCKFGERAVDLLIEENAQSWSVCQEAVSLGNYNACFTGKRLKVIGLIKREEIYLGDGFSLDNPWPEKNDKVGYQSLVKGVKVKVSLSRCVDSFFEI